MIHTMAEQTSSGKFSFLLAAEKQLPAQEHGGIVKVGTGETAPFKRKGKKLGQTFLLPLQISQVHTGAMRSSGSSAVPLGWCYTLALANSVGEGVLGLELSL